MDDALAELEGAENELVFAHRRVVEAVALLPGDAGKASGIDERVDKLGAAIVNWTGRSKELRAAYVALLIERRNA